MENRGQKKSERYTKNSEARTCFAVGLHLLSIRAGGRLPSVWNHGDLVQRNRDVALQPFQLVDSDADHHATDDENAGLHLRDLRVLLSRPGDFLLQASGGTGAGDLECHPLSCRSSGEHFPAFVDGQQVPRNEDYAEDVVHHVVQWTPWRNFLCSEPPSGILEGGNQTRGHHNNTDHCVVHHSGVRRFHATSDEVPAGGEEKSSSC